MHCPRHSHAEVTGYCSVCGAFGCPDCLTRHEEQLLCPRHYEPIARKVEEDKRREESRKKRPRQLIEVRHLDGRSQHGVSFDLNSRESTFHLDLVDATGASAGKTEAVRFADLKGVFLIKSLDGRYDKALRYPEWKPDGQELVVQFRDGETLRGFCLRPYSPEEPRFYLVPSDPTTNVISVLVEQRAIGTVLTPEEHKAHVLQEKEARVQAARQVQLSQEESLGDFYFELRNYEAAREQYCLAAAKSPADERLQGKIRSTEYNIGVQHIRRREYAKALACMESILKTNPDNPRALRKAAQLRHIMEKEGRK